MIRQVLLSSAAIALWLTAPHPAAVAAHTQDAAAAQARTQVTPAEAAPFVGDWTLALEGPNGPGTFALTVKIEKDQVTGEIGNETLANQPVTDISLDKGTLVLAYTFTYEGNLVDAVVSLTPDKEDKVAAQIDFAGGAYVMTGTAKKKDPAK
jgi:hypothetical protein